MKNYKVRAQKVEGRIQELAGFSNDPGALSRAFGTTAFIECQQKIEIWMKEAGLQTFIDNIENVRGKLLSSNPAAKTFIVGSHFDTVRDAGNYDGPLGILAGLDVIETLIERNVELPFNIELIAFSDKEGVRFNTPYLGSRIVAGNFNSDLLSIKDDNGLSLESVLESLQYDSNQVLENQVPGNEWLGYFEIHLEQGPVLFKKNIPVGIVIAIDGLRKVSIEFTGVEAHAGTVPMKMRTDALCTAAEFVLAVEQFALSKKSGVVATVGNMVVPDSASNTIPGKVLCTLDIRSGSKKKLSKAYQALNEICEAICDSRQAYFEWTLLHESNPLSSDEMLTKLLKKSIKQKDIEVIELESGAGHDAVAISRVAPFCMLFVKCVDGISHSPLEQVEIKDIAAALEITDNFIEQLSLKVLEKQD